MTTGINTMKSISGVLSISDADFFDYDTREWMWEKEDHIWDYHTIFGSGFFQFANKDDAAFFMLRRGGHANENRDG